MPSRSDAHAALRSRRTRALVAAFALASSTPSFAQEPAKDAHSLAELSLDELLEVRVETIHSASKRDESSLEAPCSPSVVRSRDIEMQGSRTLADVLRGVGGFYVTNDRNYEHVGARGFDPLGDYNSRVLLLVDGHRINNDVYDTAPIGLDLPLDVALVDRIEIVRGPGSALYGSNAFFGVIDARTKSGAEIDAVQTSVEGGSFGDLRGRLTWGHAFENGVDVVLSGSLFHSDGPSNFYDEFASTPSGGHTHGTDYEQGYSLFSKVGLGDWTIEGALGWREKGIPTGSYGTVFDDPRNATVDSQGYLDLGWHHSIDVDTKLEARVSYDREYYHGLYIYDLTSSGGPPNAENLDRGWGDWVTTSTQLTTRVFGDHRVSVGAELRDNLSQDQSNSDVLGVHLDDSEHSTSAGVFADDEYAFAAGWNLRAGARYDHYTTFGGQVSPRLGLVWQPDDRSAFKLLYGEAFRAPNVYELYYGDGSTQEANPKLEPETIKTWELIHEHYFDRDWRASASLYHYDIDSLITQTTDPTTGLLVFENLGAVRANGVELELEHHFVDGARVVASYALQRAEDVATGDRLTNSPAQLGKLSVELPLASDRYRVGVEVQGMSSRKTLAGDETSPVVLVNLNLAAVHVFDGVDFSIGVRNLFDNRYSDPGTPDLVQDQIQQNGISFFARLSVSR